VPSPNYGKAANTLPNHSKKIKKLKKKKKKKKGKTQRVNQSHMGKGFNFHAFSQKKKTIKKFSATKQTITLISKAHQS
jgi:hypothetical protein